MSKDIFKTFFVICATMLIKPRVNTGLSRIRRELTHTCRKGDSFQGIWTKLPLISLHLKLFSDSMILGMPLELASWGSRFVTSTARTSLDLYQAFLWVQELDVPAKVWPAKGFPMSEFVEGPYQRHKVRSWGSGNAREVLRGFMRSSIGSKHSHRHD